MRSLAVSTRGADWSITSVPFVEPATPPWLCLGSLTLWWVLGYQMLV